MDGLQSEQVGAPAEPGPSFDEEPTRLPLEDEDIGGELLPILSRGLYTDPLHSLREYAQNAVDEGARQIVIKITGNSVVIWDDGEGMDLDKLRRARSLGVSEKDPEHTVGFRGIGIYSGFDLCNRLLITTKRAGAATEYVLRFDFGAMKDHLRRSKQERRRTSAKDLLYLYTHFFQRPAESERHYTIVQLEEVSKVHIARMSNRKELRRYILRNLPIDFDEKYPHREEINDAIRRWIPTYNPVRVVIQPDSEAPETVCRPAIPELAPPRTDVIRDEQGRLLAFCWSSLYQGRMKIPEKYEDYRGFVYKIKGFTVGDNKRLKIHFKKGNGGLYFWYTGEIFVLDKDVVPNTSRDDFETSPAQAQLDKYVGKALSSLEEGASWFQEQSRADEKFELRKKELDELGALLLASIEREVTSPLADPPAESANGKTAFDAYKVYHQLEDLIGEVKAQRRRAREAQAKELAQQIVQRAEEYRRIVRPLEELIREVRSYAEGDREDATLHTLRRRADEIRQVIRPGDQPEAKPAGQTADSGQAQNSAEQNGKSGEASQESGAQKSSSTAAAAQKSLMQVFERSGWAVGPDCAALVAIIDASLSQVLGRESGVYESLLKDIEAKLAWQGKRRR